MFSRSGVKSLHRHPTLGVTILAITCTNRTRTKSPSRLDTRASETRLCTLVGRSFGRRILDLQPYRLGRLSGAHLDNTACLAESYRCFKIKLVREEVFWHRPFTLFSMG